MKFSLFSAVLFSTGWMSVVASGDYPPRICCLTVRDTRIPAENIVKYEMQETSLCTLRAVRFHTKKNTIICSDPDSKYAQRVMNIVDGRTAAKPTMCYTSTTNTIPAGTTTNDTPGKKTETSTSTTASRIVTTIETSRPKTETSTSTTASRIVTTIETSRPKTETSRRMLWLTRRTEPQASCCLAVTSTRIPVKDILDYYIQDSLLCPLRAVRFHTTENIIICSDPEDIWAKKAINDVNERRIPTKEPSQEPFETSITNFPTTTTIQRPNTEANTSGPTFIPRLHGNAIPVKYILKNLRSRSKKRLHKFQAGVWHRM